jgi:hypothetical protein
MQQHIVVTVPLSSITLDVLATDNKHKHAADMEEVA